MRRSGGLKVADSSVIDIGCSAANLINQLAIMLRTARLHSIDNVAFTNAADKFIVHINDMIKIEHEFVAQLRGDFFYVNGQRVRYFPGNLLNYDYLSAQFEKINIGTIIIKKEIGLEDIKFFIHSIINTDLLHESFNEFEKKMSRISGINFRRLEKIAGQDTFDARKMVRKTYLSAVMYIKGVMNKIQSDKDIDIKKAKRVFTSVINTVVDHEQILLGMTTIRDYDEYTYFHCANVSILSVALGQRLGLSRKMLIDLGIASLFHDLGKIEVPYEILNKPDRLVDAEWRIIKQHPTWGVKAILNMRDMDEFTIRSALVAFEHHMNLDHSGYPIVTIPTELDFFSKIVSIADRYDAMSTVRVYAKTPMSPDNALRILMNRSGRELDPVLCKYFINMVGVFPIGTLVSLDSDELGLVFENNRQALFRPRVMLITDSKGNRMEGHVIDLAEKNESDDYIRTITKAMDPAEYGIHTAEYLL